MKWIKVPIEVVPLDEESGWKEVMVELNVDNINYFYDEDENTIVVFVGGDDVVVHLEKDIFMSLL